MRSYSGSTGCSGGDWDLADLSFCAQYEMSSSWVTTHAGHSADDLFASLEEGTATGMAPDGDELDGITRFEVTWSGVG